MDGGETQIVTFARHADVALDSRAHCLELIDGFDFGRIFVVGSLPITLGRTAPADIVLNDSEVSRAHCKVVVLNDVFVVTDPARFGPRGDVFEGPFELNNDRPSAQPLIIERPPPSDLQVTDITAPSTVRSRS